MAVQFDTQNQQPHRLPQTTKGRETPRTKPLQNLSRRMLMLLSIGMALPGFITVANPGVAMAKDGGDDGGGDDGGSDRGDDGGDDGGSDRGDDGGDDGGNDGADRSSHDKSDRSRNDDSRSRSEQDNVLRKVRRGELISLEKALGSVRQSFKGRVIDVQLTRYMGKQIYGVKLRTEDNKIREVRVDAKTGRLLGFLGL